MEYVNAYDSFEDYPDKIKAILLAAANFTFMKNDNNIKCKDCGCTIDDWTTLSTPFHTHSKRSPNCPFIKNNKKSVNTTESIFLEGNDKYKNEHERIKSFDKWKYYSTQLPSKLASNGFYYTNDVDKVSCAYCGGTIGNWKKEHNPFEEHKGRFPNCIFVNGYINNSITASTEVIPLETSTEVIPLETSTEVIPLETSTEVKKICKICTKRKICIVLIPCGHLCVCLECKGKVTYCPNCATQIISSIDDYN